MSSIFYLFSSSLPRTSASWKKAKDTKIIFQQFKQHKFGALDYKFDWLKLVKMSTSNTKIKLKFFIKNGPFLLSAHKTNFTIDKMVYPCSIDQNSCWKSHERNYLLLFFLQIFEFYFEILVLLFVWQIFDTFQHSSNFRK